MNAPSPHQELSASYARDLEVEKPEERWLVESLWGRRAAGILGGCPKSLKTWLGLDLALSVASGTPALDHFAVEAPGTALVYLAEDELSEVRARLESLCRHRQLDIHTLDLAVITEPTLRLDTPIDQERLRATVRRFRPRLLLLDPLIRLHSGDENSSQDIARLLSYFRELQRTFDLALILVHHTSKRSRSQPGQALRGSSDLHAFGSSNAYLARKGEHQVTLTLEHRAARTPPPVTFELVSSGDGLETTHLALCREAPQEEKKPSLGELVLDLLQAEGPLARRDMRAQLRVNNERLGDALSALEKTGEIRRSPHGWIFNERNPEQGDLSS